jgi:hypothetical protein
VDVGRLEEHTGSFFRAGDGSSVFLRNAGIYLKTPHDVETQNSNINILTAVGTSNLIPLPILFLISPILKRI